MLRMIGSAITSAAFLFYSLGVSATPQLHSPFTVPHSIYSAQDAIASYILVDSGAEIYVPVNQTFNEVTMVHPIGSLCG